MAAKIRKVHVKVHRKANRLRTIAEAIGGFIVASQTEHILFAVFFVAWSALDVHEIFWGGRAA
jgi:hypothetical protein